MTIVKCPLGHAVHHEDWELCPQCGQPVRGAHWQPGIVVEYPWRGSALYWPRYEVKNRFGHPVAVETRHCRRRPLSRRERKRVVAKARKARALHWRGVWGRKRKG